MLFRKHDGTLVEINKCDYANDVIYYKKIMEVTIGKFTDINDTNAEPNYTAKDSYSTQAIHKLLCLH
uniref:Uncharacterized protein n=1 Tax=viral metagenome TaxID=1070528 RepID=A0A6C0EW07_9ZZZZ